MQNTECISDTEPKSACFDMVKRKNLMVYAVKKNRKSIFFPHASTQM